MQKTTTITSSGTGIHFEGLDFMATITPQEVPSLLEQYGFVVIHGLPWSREDLQEYFAQIGELVHNTKRAEGTFLELNGKPQTKEVLRGNGRMPLHRDGLMMQNNVRFIGIYCLDVALDSGGRTYVSDIVHAWQQVPEHIRKAYSTHGIEIMPYDTNYYLKNEKKWYPFDGVLHFNEVEIPNGGLCYHDGEERSYDIRIRDVSEAVSYQYFCEIEQVLEHPDYTYYHQWHAGDLLLLDNRAVMHGREAFEGHRNIVQIQVQG